MILQVYSSSEVEIYKIRNRKGLIIQGERQSLLPLYNLMQVLVNTKLVADLLASPALFGSYCLQDLAGFGLYV